MFFKILPWIKAQTSDTTSSFKGKTRLGVDMVKPWTSVGINLVLSSIGLDIRPGLDNRHRRSWKVMEGHRRSSKYGLCQPQSQSLSSRLWILDFGLRFGTLVWDFGLGLWFGTWILDKGLAK